MELLVMTLWIGGLIALSYFIAKMNEINKDHMEFRKWFEDIKKGKNESLRNTNRKR
jgi:putative copper export protein